MGAGPHVGHWVSAVQPPVLQEEELILCLRVQEDVGPGTWLLRRRAPATGVDNLMNEECSLPGTPLAGCMTPEAPPRGGASADSSGALMKARTPSPKHRASAYSTTLANIYSLLYFGEGSQHGGGYLL